MDVPLQSLFFSLLNYRPTMERYFYMPASDEQQTQRHFKLEFQNFEFVHLINIKGEKSDQVVQSSFIKRLIAEKGIKDPSSAYHLIREARLESLFELMDYIKKNTVQRQFFDKNGNRDMYEKFADDELLR